MLRYHAKWFAWGPATMRVVCMGLCYHARGFVELGVIACRTCSVPMSSATVSATMQVVCMELRYHISGYPLI